MCKDVLHDKSRSLNNPQGSVHTTRWEVLLFGFATRVKGPTDDALHLRCLWRMFCFFYPSLFVPFSFLFLPASFFWLSFMPPFLPFLVCILFLLLFRFCFPFLSVFFSSFSPSCLLLASQEVYQNAFWESLASLDSRSLVFLP